MKLSRKFISLLFVCFTLNCSQIYGVSHDYDRNVNFINLKTYNWLPIPENANINSLDETRIKNAANIELQNKGLRLINNNPDFFIAEHLVKKDRVNVTNWGYGYGPYGRYWGTNEVTVYQYEEGTLILDFVNAESKNLIWRGSAKADLDNAKTPEKRDMLIKASVKKILQNFPPPQGK